MKIVTFLALCLFTNSTFAVKPDVQPALVELSFLTGSWKQEQDDKVIEVQWSPVYGNSMVGTWRTIKGGQLMAYEMLTMTVLNDNSIVYRYDLHSKKDNFQIAKPSYFQLITVSGDRAEFSSMSEEEQQWRLVIEITGEGRLKGFQYDSTGEDPKIYVGYNAFAVGR